MTNTHLTDRTGERCVACRKGVYEQIVWPTPRNPQPHPGVWRVYAAHPNRVRCSDCGATVDRWRET